MKEMVRRTQRGFRPQLILVTNPRRDPTSEVRCNPAFYNIRDKAVSSISFASCFYPSGRINRAAIHYRRE